MTLPRSPWLLTSIALVALPLLLLAGGLTLTSATDVVIIAIACMALNILVGHTGLVSFGHGAWFGLGAYAAALAQRHWFPGSMLAPTGFALGFLIVAGIAVAFLVLRRRGVYFSLLTLAFAALVYAIAFRWTALTGGENGLGGVSRTVWLGIDLDQPWAYYILVALIGLGVVLLLERFHRSPIGSVLVAIRENEQRAGFIGYDTRRYKQIAYVLSALLTGLAGVLSVFHHRFASADPLAISFSGELLAMVIIGGMRSLLGPALGALFYVLFREYLSIWTANWLLFFGLLFVAFIVYSPTGLIGLGKRIASRSQGERKDGAAMSARVAASATPMPGFLRGHDAQPGPVLQAEGLSKSFGGIHAVVDAGLRVSPRSLHALIGPNGAGKTTMFNLMSGMFVPDTGEVVLEGRTLTGLPPHRTVAAGLARSFQVTQLFGELSVAENLRLAVQAGDRGSRFDGWHDAQAIAPVLERTRELIPFLGLSGIERVPAGLLSYGGQRLLDMGLALATGPRVLLLDEPLAGLAAAERERVGRLIKCIAAEVPVLLVEHDIDRVFALADRVTVMNEGRVLLDGSVAEARESASLREVYIGSGSAALAAKTREHRDVHGAVRLQVDHLDAFYGKSHIVNDATLQVHEGEIVALLGRNGAGKSTLLKSLMGLVDANGTMLLDGESLLGRPAPEIARAGIGYVPQGRGLFAGMSVRHNLELGRLRRARPEGDAWSDEKILALFPRLKDRLDAPADFLSGGEQQMVAVARALSGDVRVLLLDEPFEGLSPAVIEELFEVFDRLKGVISMIIVEHNLDLVLALADEACVLERGTVVHRGPAADLRDNLDLRRRVLWM